MLTAQDVQKSPAAAPEPAKLAERPRWQSKWVLLGAAALCYVGMWWVAPYVGLSRTRGFDGSLLLAGGAVGNILVTAALLLAAAVVGTLLAGSIRPDAGLFAAAFGLMALGNRGRPVYGVLHDAGADRTVFLVLALELVLLYAMLGCTWWMLYTLQRRGRFATDAMRDALADRMQQPGFGWSALASQVIVMATFVIFIAQSEDKKQVLAAVAIGAFFGAFLPYWQMSVRPSVWYWTGPLVVGLAGYLLAFASPPPGVAIGRPGYPAGFLAAMVRPLPLDYASIGTATALLGYWMRRKSLRERELVNAAANQPATSAPSPATAAS